MVVLPYLYGTYLSVANIRSPLPYKHTDRPHIMSVIPATKLALLAVGSYAYCINNNPPTPTLSKSKRVNDFQVFESIVPWILRLRKVSISLYLRLCNPGFKCHRRLDMHMHRIHSAGPCHLCCCLSHFPLIIDHSCPYLSKRFAQPFKLTVTYSPICLRRVRDALRRLSSHLVLSNHGLILHLQHHYQRQTSSHH